MMGNDSTSPQLPPQETTGRVPASRLASDVVSALDTIFEHLMATTPIEGASWEIPMTFSEMRATKKLARLGPVTMRVLADSLKVSLPTATHLIDRLVAKGVVVRSRPESDRRLVLVELSEKSKECWNVMAARRLEVVKHILEPLRPAVREEVARTLGEIARAALAEETASSNRP